MNKCVLCSPDEYAGLGVPVGLVIRKGFLKESFVKRIRQSIEFKLDVSGKNLIVCISLNVV